MSYDTSRPAPFAVQLPAAAFAGVRTRRFAAFCIDFAIVSVLAFLLSGVLLLATLGLAVFVMPSFWPLVAFFYNGSTVSGPRMATP